MSDGNAGRANVSAVLATWSFLPEQELRQDGEFAALDFSKGWRLGPLVELKVTGAVVGGVP